MENVYLLKLQQMVLEALKEEAVRIVLFGSRAKKNPRVGSDVDIGIIPKGRWNSVKLTLLRERIENSNIPYKVDFVDFEQASEAFRKEALKESVIWKN